MEFWHNLWNKCARNQETVGNTMNNADLVNWFASRFGRTNDLKQNYSSVIDVKDILTGNVPQEYAATQKNKPSPCGTKTFSQAASAFRDLFPDHNFYYVGWTNSMEPTFDYGDLTLFVPYGEYKKQSGALRIGQIIVYSYGNQLIIHRVIGTTSDGSFIVKGDNNYLPDPPVKESQIVSVIVGIYYTKDKVLENQD
jgi:hypothetical protein